MKKYTNCFLGIFFGSLAFMSNAYARYSVTIINNFAQAVSTSKGNSVPTGGTWTSSANTGVLNLTIPGYGSVVFQDIGYNHIDGDSTEEWGVLISYQVSDVVGRYSGDGNVIATIGVYGDIALSGNTTLREVVVSRLLLTS